MTWLTLANSSTPVLLDGAWATQLQTVGLALDACPDAWNLDHPERVQDLARRYVQAGSRILCTNTFGANRVAISGFGRAAQLAEINLAGVRLSRSAANGEAFVVASMGPSRQSLASGAIRESALVEAFTEQAEWLAEGGADGLVLETFTDLDEIQIALHCAKATGLPVVACLVFPDDSQGGAACVWTPEMAAKSLTLAGADVIGTNCGFGVESLVPICKRLRSATDRPLWIKPNAGPPSRIDGRLTYEISPEQFASWTLRLLAAGATLVGGCCGTNPQFIESLGSAIDQHRSPLDPTQGENSPGFARSSRLKASMI